MSHWIMASISLSLAFALTEQTCKISRFLLLCFAHFVNNIKASHLAPARFFASMKLAKWQSQWPHRLKSAGERQLADDLVSVLRDSELGWIQVCCKHVVQFAAFSESTASTISRFNFRLIIFVLSWIGDRMISWCFVSFFEVFVLCTFSRVAFYSLLRFPVRFVRNRMTSNWYILIGIS